VAAIGDSLTAGNGVLATNIIQVAIEYRGNQIIEAHDGQQ
jgi:hypothetical protein